MKRISIIALLTTLSAAPANAALLDLGLFGNLGAALTEFLLGGSDGISVSAGATVNAGILPPLSVGLNITGAVPPTGVLSGAINFTGAATGLILNGGIGILSNFSNTIFTGNPMGTLFTIENHQNLTLDGVRINYSDGVSNYGIITVNGTGNEFFGNTSIGHNGGAILNASGGIINLAGMTDFGSNSVTGSGGAIYNDAGGTLNLGSQLLFTTNTATGNGGAIYNNAGSTIAMIPGATGAISFISNTANTGGGGGGAIYNFGGTVDMTGVQGNILFSLNTATNGHGGAIVNTANTFNIGAAAGFSTTFSGNTSFYSGGAITNGGTMDLTGALIFDANTVTGGNGGAIANTNDITIAADALFTGNTATAGSGGAIYNTGTANIGANAVFGGITADLGNTASIGGAIANAGTLTIGAGATFENNTTIGTSTLGTGGGGAIWSSGSLTIDADATFTSNTAAAYGGAIYSAGTILDIGTGVTFSSNSASSGGAIYNYTSSTLTGTGITFNGNSATSGSGGAVYNLGTANLTGGTFSSNMATNAGGALLNAGTLTLGAGATFENNITTGTADGMGGGAMANLGLATIDSATFSSNSSASVGGAIYNFAGVNLTLNSTSFNGNTAVVAGGAITNAGTVTIGGGSAFTNNSVTYYGGAIYNEGVVTLDTTVGGNISFSGNTSQMGGDIYNDAAINILGGGGTSITLGSATGIYNNTAGTITKTGANTLNLAAASGAGAFTQTAGATISTNGFFTGGISKTNVSDSSLTVTGPSYNYGVTLGNNGVLNHTSTSAAASIIDNTTLAFAGAGASATFGASGVMGNYTLGPVDNGSANTININNSTVFLSGTSYTGGTTYNFSNDTIDLSTPGETTLRTITFDNMSAVNTALSFDISAAPVGGTETFLSDNLIINNPIGDIEFNIGTLRILNNADNGLSPIVVDNILSGATFVAGTTAEIATTAYDYKAVLNDARTGFTFDVVGESSNMSLNNMNIDINTATNRGFNFSFFPNGEVYAIGASLGAMAKGNFTVTGFNTDATTSVIDGNGTMSMFNIAGSETTNFTLSNLTVQNATRDMGAGLLINNANATATISNVIFDNNTSLNYAGAILYEAGTLNVSNTTFRNNSASIGGAVTAIGSDINLVFGDNVVFDGNHANNGGAIVTESTVADSTLTFNGSATFTNNYTDADGGFGGAIVMAGLPDKKSTLTFNMSDGTNVYFDGNYDTLGGNNDIMMDSYNSEIYFSGTGGVATLNGGIADLNGYEALLGGPAIDNVTSNVYVDGNVTVNFGAESVNKNFFGNFNQSAGVTNVYADNWIAGANNVSGGRLNIFQTMTVGDVNLTTGGAIGIGDGVSAQVLTTPNFMGDGTGNVWLNTNGTWSDMLKITGTAAGGGILNFNVIGNSPTSQKIEVVDMTGATDNGAIFTLAGGTLDIGAWAYDLVHEADGNWYLESEGTLSTTAQSVMGIPGLHLSVVKTGMNELRKRLGHLRNNNNDEQLTGPWIRAYGEHLKVHELVNAKMDVAGLEGGIDFMANMWNGKVYFGVMGGMLDSENIRFKTSVGGAGGWTRTPSVGAYATWVHKSGSSNKWFVDLTARHFWAHTYVEKDDKTNGYDVTRNFWAFSGETGKLYYMESPEWMNIGSLQHSHLSIEPKVEVRYKSGAAMDFETFAGDQGHVDTTESFTTHLNVQLNFLPNGTLSTWRPWIELGVYNEWLGDTEMEFAGEKLCSSDTRGMGMRAAIGTSAELSERTYIYGGYTFEDGEIYTSHLLNIGIRTKF